MVCEAALIIRNLNDQRGVKKVKKRGINTVLLYTVSQLLRGVRVCFLLCARVKLCGRRRQKEGANETKPHPALLYARAPF